MVISCIQKRKWKKKKYCLWDNTRWKFNYVLWLAFSELLEEDWSRFHFIHLSSSSSDDFKAIYQTSFVLKVIFLSRFIIFDECKIMPRNSYFPQARPFYFSSILMFESLPNAHSSFFRIIFFSILNLILFICLFI